MPSTRLVLLLTSAAALAPGAAPAGAAVTCDFDPAPGTQAVEVTLSAAGDEARIHVDTGFVKVNGNACLSPAIVAATVHDTARVVVRDVSLGGSTRVEIAEPALFAPGHAAEHGGLGHAEIEFDVTQGGGADDVLALAGGAAADAFTAGAGGIDVDPDDPFPDVDVATSGADRLELSGGGQGDELSARGGGITGAAWATPATLAGGPGADQLADGDGDDTLDGGDGSDAFELGAGDDAADGGAEPDQVGYAAAPAGVVVDLTATGPQATGGAGTDTLTAIESVRGSLHDDRLTGRAEGGLVDGRDGDDELAGGPASDGITGGAGDDRMAPGGGTDMVEGWAGDDTVTFAASPQPVRFDVGKIQLPQLVSPGASVTHNTIENVEGSAFADRLTGDPDGNVLTGGRGADELSGGGGPDVFRVRDGVADRVSCGDDPDTVVGDAAGVDAIAADCETLDLTPGPEAPGAPAAGALPAAAPPAFVPRLAVPDRLAPVLARLAVVPRRLRSGALLPGLRRGGAIRLKVSEPAAVTFTFLRLKGKRRIAVRGQVVVRVPAGSSAVGFQGRLSRVRRLAPGSYRVSARARDAAGNRGIARTATFTVLRRRGVTM